VNTDIIVNNIDRFVSGTLLTLELAALSVFLGLCLAVPLALARLSRHWFLWMPSYAYIFYFRGTPLLVQIFLIYYGIGQYYADNPELRAYLQEIGLWTYLRNPYPYALLTLTLNTAAYVAEIIRGGILAVPHGEVEAARACGMSRFLMLRRIILPRAFRIALPAYTNDVVFTFQATSLVSIITIMDLTGVARVLISRSFAAFEIWIFVGAIYCALSYAILYGFRLLEYHWSGHLRERPGVAGKPAAAPAGAAAIVR
jgi:octopine/nopaline transport system permease protein/arginine/ornithine transport system permease protein